MSTLTYWTGSVSQEISGSTPFGIYDGDSVFQSDEFKDEQIGVAEGWDILSLMLN